MKKVIKLTLFNLAILALLILGFYKRGLGLSFNPSLGAGKFGFSLFFTTFIILFFLYGNYKIFTKKEKFTAKNLSSLTSINDFIDALEKFKKTTPSFETEISKAISQLEILNRRHTSLQNLLEYNNIVESFGFLNDSAKTAEQYVFENMKKIINRLIIFDNQEYIENENSSNFQNHMKVINKIIDETDEKLKEYQDLLIALSKTRDKKQSKVDDIQRMIRSLNSVSKGEETTTIEKKISTQEDSQDD